MDDNPYYHSGCCRLLEARLWDPKSRPSIALGTILRSNWPDAKESSAEETVCYSRGQKHARVILFGRTRCSSNSILAVRRYLKAGKVPSEAQSRGPLKTVRETGYCLWMCGVCVGGLPEALSASHSDMLC